MKKRSVSRAGMPLRILGLLLGLALIAAACGDDDATTTTPPTTPATTAAPTTPATTAAPTTPATTAAPTTVAPTAAPTTAPPAVPDQTLVWALQALATDFDPTVYQGSGPTQWIAYELKSTLVEYDLSGLAGEIPACDVLASTANVSPGLAESWEYNADRTSITFKLREGVLSSAGNELTSEDVRWAFERSLQPDSNAVAKFLWFIASGYAGVVEDGHNWEDLITVVDKYTFQLHLVNATPVDIASMAHWSMRIADSTEAKKHATADDPFAYVWLSLNGPYFGPWGFTEADFDPGTQMTLTANPNYTRERGNIGTVIARNIPEEDTRLQLLLSGDVDFAHNLRLDQYAGLAGQAGVSVYNCASPTRDVLNLSYANPTLANTKVREAISLALDRDALVQGAYQGLAQPAIAALHQGFQANPVKLPQYEHDPESARTLLAEAGFPGGFDLILTYSPGDPGPQTEPLAVLIQAQLRDVGINVTLDPLPAAEFSPALREGAAEAWIFGQNPAVPHPYYAMLLFNKSTSFLNYQGYDDPTFDGLLTQSEEAAPGAAQDAVIQQTNEYMANVLPEIALADKRTIRAVLDTITGLTNRSDSTSNLHLFNKG